MKLLTIACGWAAGVLLVQLTKGTLMWGRDGRVKKGAVAAPEDAAPSHQHPVDPLIVDLMNEMMSLRMEVNQLRAVLEQRGKDAARRSVSQARPSRKAS